MILRKEHVLAMLSWGLAVSPLLASVPDFELDTETDSLRNFKIDEAVVVASPKETGFLKDQPLSFSQYGKSDMEMLKVNSIKGLSAFAPNFFMPDYGSRLTSAVYVRGIGTRVNTPAVGLYVDNVAYTDKSAYDFSFMDVERVDVLRGPQGTLYGRNTMGGLVRVFTADPLKKKGSVLDMGAATDGGPAHAKFHTYLKASDRLAFSVGGFYEMQTGFFDNATSAEEADGFAAGGGKVRAAWRPDPSLRFDWTAAYEYTDEDACPYFLLGHSESKFPALSGHLGEISQNRQCNYRRGLFNTNLTAEWQAPHFVLSSVTGYQNLDDRLFMDQDFTALDVFSLRQQQQQNTFTEELSLRSHKGKRWQWTTGAFLMYQQMDTDCPVTFYQEGMDFLNHTFQGVFAGVNANYPELGLGLKFKEDHMGFDAALETPNLNAALFHQSTIHGLFADGLSLTLGLRAEYDRHELDLVSGISNTVRPEFSMKVHGNPMSLLLRPMLAEMSGEESNADWQLLPKVALQYDFSRGNVFASVTKGYRSGGYNIQAYSDLSQQLLQREIMTTLSGMVPKESIKEIIAKYTPAQPQLAELNYDPEESWNYELGGRFNVLEGALSMDYTLFYSQTKNQQLARFAESGMGRVTVNAGKSRSYGAELSLRSSLLDHRLLLSAAYGYTHAELREHYLGSSRGQSVDYSGNRVPFAPEHTLGAYAQFRQPLSHRVCKALYVGANVQGAGRMYWDEANTFRQPFYAVMGANIGVELIGNVKLELWGKNLTGTDYKTFSFESMGNRFAQYGEPRHFGANLNIQF